MKAIKLETIFSIGVDLGGTWIRVVALGASGESLESYRGPAPTLDQLPSFLKSLFHKWHQSIPCLAVASRGVWTAAERQELKKACRGLASAVQVLSDVEAAWLAAFGKGGCGILIIAGTGSIAYTRDSKGRGIRTGGLGPLLGDEGSGFWLGREWIRAGMMTALRRAGVSQIASLAPTVLKKARKKSHVARDIVSAAQGHLAELILHIARSWPTQQPIPICCAGSVLDDPLFRKGFFERLRRGTDHALVEVFPRHDAATAAALLFVSSKKTR